MVKIESEKELENYLAQLVSSRPNHTKLQQVRLGSYGVADLIYWTVATSEEHNTLMVHVIETKQGSVGYKALAQLCRYMKAVEMNLTAEKEKMSKLFINFEVYGLLVGAEIDNMNDIGFVLAQMQNVYIYKYVVTIKSGLKVARWPGWMRGIPNEKFPGKPLVALDELLSAIEYNKNNPTPTNAPNSHFIF
ncbi:MAG: hypothetical protein V3573_02945 [Desulfovibrionaceae bacterium]